MLIINSIDTNDALELQAHIFETASRDRGNPVAICVVDARGVQLSALTMFGTKAPSIDTAHAKAVSAINFERDTIRFRFKQNDMKVWIPAGIDGWDHNDVANAMKINPIFCAWAGGVLVRSPHDNGIIGAIGVSNRSEFDDHDLASARPSGWTA